MKNILLILSLCFSLLAGAEEITDFNAPLWNYGTGTGADASGSGVVAGVPFTIAFNLNNGVKLFTEPPLIKTNQYTSNATIGHGGPAGSLLLAGTDEGLMFTFASPVSITLGLSHINNSTDGWNFITPADEVVSLHREHEIIDSGSIDGVRQNASLGAVTTSTDNISYFKWINVTTIHIQTTGSPYTTLALSSMNVVPFSTAVPSLSTWGVLMLIGVFGFFGVLSSKTRIIRL